MREAVSFDPSNTVDSTHHYGVEKGRASIGRNTIDNRSSDEHARRSTYGAGGFGEQPGYGHNSNFSHDNPGYATHFPQPPPRILSPYGYPRNNNMETLPALPQQDNFNWGQSLTPFTAPLPATFGAPNDGNVDGRTIPQVLKVCRKKPDVAFMTETKF